MFQNSTAPRNRVPQLTVVGKEKKEGSTAKILILKRVNNKSKILLPPSREQYIKAKRHDFL
jgi:hypothetical protein